MRFSFRLVYLFDLAPGPAGEAFVERRHHLHIFLSRDLMAKNHYGVKVLDMSRGSITKYVEIEIHEEHFPIHSTSGIGVNAYCRTWAPQGYECRTTAGSGFLYLKDVIEAVSKNYETSNGKLTFNVALCERTSTVLVRGRRQPVIKGRVVFSLQLSKSILGKQIQVHPSPFPFLERQALEEHWQRIMLHFCQASVKEVNDHFMPSEPRQFMEVIRCPFFENDVLLLWGAAYSAMTTRKDLDYALFEHLLQISLKRHHLTSKALERSIGTDKAFFQERGYELFSSVVAHLLSAITWALPYMPDAVNGNRSYPFKPALLDNVYNEHYKNTLTVLEGDCDGLAWLSHLMAIEAIRMNSVSDNESTVGRRVLQLLSRHYMPFMVQGAATVGNAADSKTDDDDDASGLCCHTYGILMPLYMVRQCLSRVPQKIPGLDAIRPAFQDHREAVLDVILLEGTGPCAPLQVQADDESPLLKPYVKQVQKLEEKYPVLQNLQRLMYRHHKRTFSVFYQSAVTAYSSLPFFVHGIPSMDILFVRHEKSSSTYGITAEELFTKAPTTGMYFFNDLKRELQPGICALDVMQGVFQRLEPVPNVLVPSPEEKQTVIAYVNQLLQGMLYDSLPSQALCSSSSWKHKQHTVTYYCRLDNLNKKLLHILSQLHKQGVLIQHEVIPLAITELQRACMTLSSLDKDTETFPITSVDITLTLSTDQSYI